MKVLQAKHPRWIYSQARELQRPMTHGPTCSRKITPKSSISFLLPECAHCMAGFGHPVVGRGWNFVRQDIPNPNDIQPSTYISEATVNIFRRALLLKLIAYENLSLESHLHILKKTKILRETCLNWRQKGRRCKQISGFPTEQNRWADNRFTRTWIWASQGMNGGKQWWSPSHWNDTTKSWCLLQ